MKRSPAYFDGFWTGTFWGGILVALAGLVMAKQHEPRVLVVVIGVLWGIALIRAWRDGG